MLSSKENIFLLILWVFYTTVQVSLNPQLVLQSNDCGCVIYECTVSGEGVIIWTGSAFDCPGVSNEIILLVLDRGTIECNNGAIKAQRNNNYTSQLIITDRSLNGSNIECIYENGTNLNVIGNLSIPTIKEHSEPLSPPIDFQLVHVYTDQLVFKWNRSVQCSSLQYEISATGCGNCPNYTVNNSVTCRNIPLNKSTGESLCMFAVKSIVCESNESNESSLNTVNATLKVPLVTITNVLPTYEVSQSQELIKLKTTFRDSVGPFNFSDTIDGSALFYTINYMKSNSSTTCASAKVQAVSCLNQTCEHTSIKSNVSACLTSPGITVTVFGTNRLGNGSASNPALIGTFSETTNRFANITVSQNSSTIVCTFINWQNGSNSTCTVHVYCPNINDGCDKIIYSTHNILYTTTSSSDSDTVTIEITDFHQVPSIVLYCFIVTASNGSFMAEVIGSFNTTGTVTLNTKTETVTVTVVILTLFGIITFLGLIAAISAVYIKKRKSIIEIRIPNNIDSTSEEEHYTLPPGVCSTSQEIGVCNSPQSAEESESWNGTNTMIYADINPNTATKGKVMLPPLDDRVEYAQVQHNQTETSHTESEPTPTPNLVDGHMNLDNLLIHLRDEVTPKWYELGEIIGVPKETLDKYSEHAPDQCIIEVLDYWLMLYGDKLTWKDVAHALKELSFHLLSEKVLQIHEKRHENEAGDSLSPNEDDHQFQQNLDSLAISFPPTSPSNLEDAESKEATDQLIDMIAEDTLPPPLPPKCKELLLECAND